MLEDINGHTRLLAFIADPAEHTLSPRMHNYSFEKYGINYVYLAFQINQTTIEQAVNAIRTLDFRGVNLSMPNKQVVAKYLDRIDPVAELANSVNTIVNDNGFLTGYTTDGRGFMNALRDRQVDYQGKTMTMLGCGGAGMPIAVQAALDGMEKIVIFNRVTDPQWEPAKRQIALLNQKMKCQIELVDLADQTYLKSSIENSQILCNATSVGMGKLADLSLVNDPSWFHSDMVVVDAVYEPRETKLMRIVESAGVEHVFNGLELLIQQGAESFKLWTGHEMPIDEVRNLLN